MIAPRPDPFDLDGEFPLGDGKVDTEATVICPFCHQVCRIDLDPGSGPLQEYIEDCEICCRPWRVRVRYDAEGMAHVHVTADDGA